MRATSQAMKLYYTIADNRQIVFMRKHLQPKAELQLSVKEYAKVNFKNREYRTKFQMLNSEYRIQKSTDIRQTDRTVNKDYEDRN